MCRHIRNARQIFSSFFMVIIFYFSLPLILPIFLLNTFKTLLGNRTSSPCTELDIKCLLFFFFFSSLLSSAAQACSLGDSSIIQCGAE